MITHTPLSYHPSLCNPTTQRCHPYGAISPLCPWAGPFHTTQRRPPYRVIPPVSMGRPETSTAPGKSSVHLILHLYLRCQATSCLHHPLHQHRLPERFNGLRLDLAPIPCGCCHVRDASAVLLSDSCALGVRRLHYHIRTGQVGIQNPGPQKFREVIERGLTRFSAFFACFK